MSHLRLPAVLWHLLPILPLVEGLYVLTVAAVLLVALPYIKVTKFMVQLQDLLGQYNVGGPLLPNSKIADVGAKKAPTDQDAQLTREIKKLKAVRDRWAKLTFLKVR